MDPAVAKIAQATIEENFNNYIRKLNNEPSECETSRNMTTGPIDSSYQNGSKKVTRLRLGYGTTHGPKKTGRVQVKSPAVRNGASRVKQSSARQADEARINEA